MTRNVTLERRTNETQITLSLNLGGGSYEHQTGVGFFDHMLDHLARHGGLGLTIQAQGDHQVDDHHTVEDVGIVLGQAMLQALGDKKGIERYGYASVPMDETLVRATVDLSGRYACVFNSESLDKAGKIGTFDAQLVREFVIALATNAKMNCHIEVVRAGNAHHVAEAVFKALGRALRQAIAITGQQVPSTKGSL